MSVQSDGKIILGGNFGGINGVPASFVARLFGAAPAALANDSCNGAIAMTPGMIYTENTAIATSAGDPTPSCQSSFGRGVWYTITPAISGVVAISTCGSDFDTVVQVYTGSCGSLTALSGGCNDDNGPSCDTSQASVSFIGTAGTTYWILSGGFSGTNGSLNIVATAPQPPAITSQPFSQ